MRTGRDIEVLQRQLAAAMVERDGHRVHGQGEVYLKAYVAVKALELRLDEKRREVTRRS